MKITDEKISGFPVPQSAVQRELIGLFIAVCRSVRDPNGRKGRLDMAAYAAECELAFVRMLNEIKPEPVPKASPQPVEPVAA